MENKKALISTIEEGAERVTLETEVEVVIPEIEAQTVSRETKTEAGTSEAGPGQEIDPEAVKEMARSSVSFRERNKRDDTSGAGMKNLVLLSKP